MDAPTPTTYNGLMKICAAQMAPAKGQLVKNLAKHMKLVELAVSIGAHFVFFPELSLVGYEPTMAKELATSPDDARLAELQNLSDDKMIAIAAGLPIRNAKGIFIGMVIFRPHQPRQLYCKQFLHADEFPYFIPGNTEPNLTLENLKLSPAICYESLLWEHSDRAAREGAKLYFASVAKSADGVSKAESHFPEVAKKHGMIVLMANSLGPNDNFTGAGSSAAWDKEGKVMARMNSTEEGLLVYDASANLAQAVYI